MYAFLMRIEAGELFAPFLHVFFFFFEPLLRIKCPIRTMDAWFQSFWNDNP